MSDRAHSKLTDIMIFAAGFGTRMRPLTDDRPKPLIEVAGRALLDHALDLARPLDLPITINAHYKAEQIHAHLAGTEINVITESPDILETGGGLKNAQMKGPVVALNSDAMWRGPNPLELLRAAWKDHMETLLLLVPQTQTVGYDRGGNFNMSNDGHLTHDLSGDVYTGAQITTMQRVNAHPQAVFSMLDLWKDMARDGTLYGIRYPGRWADIGTPQGIPLAERMLNV